METINPVSVPTIFVNGVAQINDIEQSGLTVTNQPPLLVHGEALITFLGPVGSEVRYTLGGSDPTLGSPLWSAGQPIIVRKNGNGFSSDNTIIKAKAFLRGQSSKASVLELNINN